MSNAIQRYEIFKLSIWPLRYMHLTLTNRIISQLHLINFRRPASSKNHFQNFFKQNIIFKRYFDFLKLSFKNYIFVLFLEKKSKQTNNYSKLLQYWAIVIRFALFWNINIFKNHTSDFLAPNIRWGILMSIII